MSSLLLHCCSLCSHSQSYRNATTKELGGHSELCVQLKHCSPCSQIQLLSWFLSLHHPSPAQERSWTPPCPGAVHPMLSMENCNTQELYTPKENRLRAPSAPWQCLVAPTHPGNFCCAKFPTWNRKCVKLFKSIKDPKH